ncbi:aminopeptidase PepB [Aliikangiella marina]|uniref:Aminopeptidase PepB n=1 Tax=Aliikangiella marina TaxID=1712262 RepID=A0A545TC55_9GAMM|nr:aminopeptidase PepB [Aliikangiella marina]TQV74803.1 aminopeptidase PepB [Aliikangiella marina]
MQQTFQIALSDDRIESQWGDKNNLSFTTEGATIHLPSLEDVLSNLEMVQKAGRQLASMKIPSFVLVGHWSLEAQWHFWQGAFSPKKLPAITFAELGESEKQILDNRIKVLSWVRSIINQTPEDLSPINLATQAAEFLSELAPESISYQLIADQELVEKEYVGIHGVGRGSTRPPVLLTLDYCPDGWQDQAPAAALVGKGITFDSGGYSMKSTLGMLHMKSDMGGAATVAGALGLAIANGLNKRVKLFLCCAENLVSGQAYKLADILEYRNGVSVEVVNTDAEGRLVLADGLIDAAKTDAPVIIDAATLTGAAVVAVGDKYNALFSLDDQLAEDFASVAQSEHDLTWRLPLTLDHQNYCPSAYADTANSRPIPGGGAGGASNAAGFLSRFLTNPEKGWLHLDLAACYKDSANNLWSAGATGRGVRSVAAFLNQL